MNFDALLRGLQFLMKLSMLFLGLLSLMGVLADTLGTRDKGLDYKFCTCSGFFSSSLSTLNSWLVASNLNFSFIVMLCNAKVLRLLSLLRVFAKLYTSLFLPFLALETNFFNSYCWMATLSLGDCYMSILIAPLWDVCDDSTKDEALPSLAFLKARF